MSQFSAEAKTTRHKHVAGPILLHQPIGSISVERLVH